MKIIDAETNKILYDSGRGEDQFLVSPKFFKALKSGKIRYMSGGKRGGIRYSEIKTLDIKDEGFSSTFKGIAMSEIGKAVINETMPLSTIL